MIRLISQDRTCEINYEDYDIWIDEGTIKAIPTGEAIEAETTVILGRYDYEEKAIEIMDKIRKRLLDKLDDLVYVWFPEV